MQKTEFSTRSNAQNQFLLSAWPGATSRDKLLFLCVISVEAFWILEYSAGIIGTPGLGSRDPFSKFPVAFAIKLIPAYPSTPLLAALPGGAHRTGSPLFCHLISIVITSIVLTALPRCWLPSFPGFFPPQFFFPINQQSIPLLQTTVCILLTATDKNADLIACPLVLGGISKLFIPTMKIFIRQKYTGHLGK